MPARILIVDEHVTRRITMAARLSGDFYEIRAASDPFDAEEQLRDWRPQVLLVADDLTLVPTGRFLHGLRSDPRFSDLTIFVLTAPGAHVGRAALYTAGADDVISRSEAEDVFRARLRAHDRARTMANKLKIKGKGLAGLEEPAQGFLGRSRVIALAPDAARTALWRQELSPFAGLQFEVRQAPLAGQALSLPRRGLFLLGCTAEDLQADGLRGGLRLLEEIQAHRDPLKSDILLLQEVSDTRVTARAFDLGAGAVATLGAAPDWRAIAMLLRRLHVRLGGPCRLSQPLPKEAQGRPDRSAGGAARLPLCLAMAGKEGGKDTAHGPADLPSGSRHRPFQAPQQSPRPTGRQRDAARCRAPFSPGPVPR